MLKRQCGQKVKQEHWFFGKNGFVRRISGVKKRGRAGAKGRNNEGKRGSRVKAREVLKLSDYVCVADAANKTPGGGGGHRCRC